MTIIGKRLYDNSSNVGEYEPKIYLKTGGAKSCEYDDKGRSLKVFIIISRNVSRHAVSRCELDSGQV